MDETQQLPFFLDPSDFNVSRTGDLNNSCVPDNKTRSVDDPLSDMDTYLHKPHFNRYLHLASPIRPFKESLVGTVSFIVSSATINDCYTKNNDSTSVLDERKIKYLKDIESEPLVEII